MYRPFFLKFVLVIYERLDFFDFKVVYNAGNWTSKVFIAYSI